MVCMGKIYHSIILVKQNATSNLPGKSSLATAIVASY